MIKIEVLHNKRLEEVLFNRLQSVVERFDKHFEVKTTIFRTEYDISKVDKLLWGEEAKKELWEKIMSLTKSPKIKALLTESGAFLRRLSTESLEVGLKHDKHYSKLVGTRGVKESLLKVVEKITGIVPSLGVRFHLLPNNSGTMPDNQNNSTSDGGVINISTDQLVEKFNKLQQEISEATKQFGIK